MEVYLNVIEMGDGVYGAEATANLYFNKKAIYLSKSEAALIAAVLPNPRKFSIARPSPYIRKRQAWIIRQMGYWGGVINYDTPAVKVRNK
jgi:monofunctional biosynthetic peptidoglycan transglycosylase